MCGEGSGKKGKKKYTKSRARKMCRLRRTACNLRMRNSVTSGLLVTTRSPSTWAERRHPRRDRWQQAWVPSRGPGWPAGEILGQGLDEGGLGTGPWARLWRALALNG